MDGAGRVCEFVKEPVGGYMAEYELDRDVTDAVGSRLYSGNVVARSFGL